jgi:chromosome segregation ATPase
MLAHASTATFAVSVFGYMSKWLGANAWAGFVFGFSILALSIVWPEIRNTPWLVRLRLPKSPHEQLRGRVDDLMSAVSQSLDLQKQFSEHFGNRISTLEQDRTKAIGERSQLSTHFSTIKRELNTAVERLDNVENYAKSILMAHSGVETVAQGLGSRIDQLHMWLNDLEQTLKQTREELKEDRTSRGLQ